LRFESHEATLLLRYAVEHRKGHTMRKPLSAILAAGLMAFAASAGFADGLPSGRAAPGYAAPPSWSGLYVSGGLGYGAWTADTTTVSPVTGVCVLCVSQTQGGEGMFGTIGIGYDVQVHQRYVLGAFVDASFGGIEGTIQDQGPFFVGTIKEDRMFAVGGRAGYLINPMILTYATVGYTNAHFGGANMVTAFAGAPTAFSTSAFSRDGWFIGSGMEAMLVPGWFWRMEYRYAGYGRATLRDTQAVGLPQNSITFDPIEQTVRSELVFKFH
jgi:outer membrane immunogenic protein